ncbi:MAG TPA: tryptophan--tRNA ligase, partial [Chlamydiales bacterium]|nr:tryptophan--tRNA ligase [Chlamydiales bacterium]
RLPGIDGKAKMSKSLQNAIFLSDDVDMVAKKVKGMYTDPNHLRVEDPGKVEGNPVFTYLDAFGKDIKKISELKEHYSRGGLGDTVIKKYLTDVLQEFLDPIRKARLEFAKDPQEVMAILKNGTEVAIQVAHKTLIEVRAAMGINYF